MIQDWYHQQNDDLLSSFLSVYNPTGAERMHDFFILPTSLLLGIKLITLSLLQRLLIQVSLTTMPIPHSTSSLERLTVCG